MGAWQAEVKAVHSKEIAPVPEGVKVVDIWDSRLEAEAFQEDVELPDSAELAVTESGGGEGARDYTGSACHLGGSY